LYENIGHTTIYVCLLRARGLTFLKGIVVCSIRQPVCMSEWLLFNTKWAIFQLYHGVNKLHSMRWLSLCTRPTSWIFNWNNSHLIVTPLGHIVLIPIQPIFALTPYCCMLRATDTNFIVSGLNRAGLEPTIFSTRSEHANHYSRDVAQCLWTHMTVIFIYVLHITLR
jgi:hypothetical protein